MDETKTVEHVKGAARALRDLVKSAPTWELLAHHHVCGNTTVHESLCLALREALDAEQERTKILEQRIKDLCEEIERLQPPKRIFVCGPEGVEDVRETDIQDG